jgi:hypothetical protein
VLDQKKKEELCSCREMNDIRNNHRSLVVCDPGTKKWLLASCLASGNSMIEKTAFFTGQGLCQFTVMPSRA